MKIKKVELLYFLAICMLLIRSILQVSTLINISSSSIFFDVLLFTAYALLFIKIIYKESIKNLIIYAIIISLAIFAYIHSKMTDYLTLVLIVIATKDIEIRKIIKFVFVFYVIALAIHIIAYLITMFIDSSSIQVIHRDDIKRYSFFLGHPNSFAAILAWTNIMFLYLKYEKLKAWDYIVTILVALFIYFVPNSRTSAILLIVFIAMILLFKKNIKIIIKFGKISIPLIAIIMFGLFLAYNMTPIIDKIDGILNARIKLALAIYENYGISLFGVYIPFGQELSTVYKYGLTQLTVDSAYYSLLFSYGVVNTLIFLIIYTRLNFKKNFENKKILFLTIWSFYAVTETLALNPLLCFPLLFATELLEKRKKAIKDES